MMMKQANDPNEPVNLNEVDKLAKLLATENIAVEHHNDAKTASFDLKNRVLRLPCWTDLTKSLYHMLIGHETGHALYTNRDSWAREVDAEPRMGIFLNVVEDARIEKLMKEKFPGLRRDFHYGYKTLNSRDFFKLKDLGTPLEACSLLDRLNLHFKLGNFVKIPFAADELKFVADIEAARSFEDVIRIARELFERAIEKTGSGSGNQGQHTITVKIKQAGRGQQGPEAEKDDGQEGQDSDGAGQEDAEGDSDPSKGGGMAPKSVSDNEGESSPEDESEGDIEIEIVVDELSAESYDALNEALQNMVSNNTQKNNFAYVDLPKKIDYKNHVIEYKELLEYVRRNYAGALRSGQYPALYKKNIKTINYLIKEFELRKAARLYERASEAKTGVINVNRLHQYQLVDDIFKRNTVLPKGKNHGIVMFVDFSGSMSNIMRETIIELFNLTVFCRKVKIPFRVFAFTDNKLVKMRFNRRTRDVDYEGPLTLAIAPGAMLIELFNNKMNSKDFGDAMEALLSTFGGHTHIDIFGLASTPLNCSVIMAHGILQDFRTATSADIVSAVFLTDGDSNGLCVSGRGSGTVSYSHKLVIKNKMTGHSYSSRESSYASTDALFRSLAGMGFNVIGYRVGEKNDLRHCLQIHAGQLDSESYQKANSDLYQDNCTMLNNFRGCDQYYLLAFTGRRYYRNEASRGDNDEFSFEIKTRSDKPATKAQITKAFIAARENKMGNRKILSNFAKKVSGETK
jgi:hypothetical protein